MKKLKCPNCEVPMTFITFAKSPTPWHLKCSNCMTKLQIDKYQMISIIISLIFGISVGIIGGMLNLTLPFFILFLVTAGIFFEYIGFTLLKILEVNLKSKV